jgi:hypothetical protein
MATSKKRTSRKHGSKKRTSRRARTRPSASYASVRRLLLADRKRILLMLGEVNRDIRDLTKRAKKRTSRR